MSDISRTKYQNMNVSRFVLQLSLPNILKPCVKSRIPASDDVVIADVLVTGTTGAFAGIIFYQELLSLLKL